MLLVFSYTSGATEEKSLSYPFNPLEGKREGESKDFLKAKALEAINFSLPLELRSANLLEAWGEPKPVVSSFVTV